VDLKHEFQVGGESMWDMAITEVYEGPQPISEWARKSRAASLAALHYIPSSSGEIRWTDVGKKSVVDIWLAIFRLASL